MSRLDRFVERFLPWLVLALAGGLAFGIVYGSHRRTHSPCEAFVNSRVEDLPVRCFKDLVLPRPQ